MTDRLCDNCGDPASKHPRFIGQRGWTDRPCTVKGCNCGNLHFDSPAVKAALAKGDE